MVSNTPTSNSNEFNNKVVYKTPHYLKSKRVMEEFFKKILLPKVKKGQTVFGSHIFNEYLNKTYSGQLPYDPSFYGLITNYQGFVVKKVNGVYKIYSVVGWQSKSIYDPHPTPITGKLIAEYNPKNDSLNTIFDFENAPKSHFPMYSDNRKINLNTFEEEVAKASKDKSMVEVYDHGWTAEKKGDSWIIKDPSGHTFTYTPIQEIAVKPPEVHYGGTKQINTSGSPVPLPKVETEPVKSATSNTHKDVVDIISNPFTSNHEQSNVSILHPIPSHHEEKYVSKIPTNKPKVNLPNVKNTSVSDIKKTASSITAISAQEHVIADLLNSDDVSLDTKKELIKQLEKAEEQKKQAAVRLYAELETKAGDKIKNKKELENQARKIVEDSFENINKLHSIENTITAHEYLNKALEKTKEKEKKIGSNFVHGLKTFVEMNNPLVTVADHVLQHIHPEASKNNTLKTAIEVGKVISHGVTNFVEEHAVDMIPIVGPAIHTKMLGDTLQEEKRELLNKNPEAVKEYSKEAKEVLKEEWKQAKKNIEFQTIATAAGIAAGAVAETIAQGVEAGEVGSHIIRSSAQATTDLLSTKLVYGSVKPIDVGVALLNFATPIHAETEATKTIETEAEVYRTNLKYTAFKSNTPTKFTEVLTTDTKLPKIALIDNPDTYVKAEGSADVLAKVGDNEVKPMKVNLEVEELINSKTGFAAQKVKVINPETKNVESEDLKVFRKLTERKGVEKRYSTFLSVWSGEPEKYKFEIKSIHEPDEESGVWKRKGRIKITQVKSEKLSDNSLASVVNVEDETNKMSGYIYSESKETPKGVASVGEINLIDPAVQVTKTEESIEESSMKGMSNNLVESAEESASKSDNNIKDMLGLKDEESTDVIDHNYIKVPDKIKVNVNIKRLFKLKAPFAFGFMSGSNMSYKLKPIDISIINLDAIVGSIVSPISSQQTKSKPKTKDKQRLKQKSRVKTKQIDIQVVKNIVTPTNFTDTLTQNNTTQQTTTITDNSSPPPFDITFPNFDFNINPNKKVKVNLNIKGFAPYQFGKLFEKSTRRRKSKLIIFKDTLF